MDNQILNSYSKISDLNVSRETCNELERLILMIQEKNKEINIISREIYQKEHIRERHIILPRYCLLKEYSNNYQCTKTLD